MDKRWRRLGLVALALGAAACSGADDEPARLTEGSAGTDLAGRMSADLGVPVVAEVVGRSSYALVAEKTRVVARGNDRDTQVLAWVKGYAQELGMAPEALSVRSAGEDGLGLHHVLVSSLPADVDGGDAGIEVVLDPEGRFVSLSGHVPKVDGAPRISREDAERIGKHALAVDDVEPDEIMIRLEARAPGGSTSDDDAALTYRVASDSATAWIDAATGSVLVVMPNDEGVAAFSAEDAFAPPIPATFLRRGKTLEVETRKWDGQTYVLEAFGTGAHLVVKSLDSYGQDGTPITTGPITSTSADRFDVGFNAYEGRGKPRSHASVADQVAVDALHNVSLADTFFRKRLGRGPVAGFDAAFGDGIEIVVHANVAMRRDRTGKLVEVDARNNASFNPRTKQISFGDGWLNAAGTFATNPDNQRLPTALALDVVGHELTHAFARHEAEPGEVGAIQEGLADVIGQIFERSAGGGSRTAATVGERIWPNGHGRNIKNPDRGLPSNLFKVVGKSNVPYPNHVEKQLCARVVNGKIVREAPTFDNDWGCVHDNALVVGHAFYLMTFGGLNSTSLVQVDGAKSVADVERLWMATLGVAGQKGILATPVRDFASLARFQVAAAFATSPADARSVGCAWHAVGALDKRTVDALGLACNVLPYAQCWLPGPNGAKVPKPDGVYCNERYVANSYTCRGGAILEGGSCLSGEACAVRVPRTNEAMLTPGGVAACESAFP